MLNKYYAESKIELINKIIMFISLFMLGIIPIIMYKHISISYSPVFLNNSYATGEKLDIFNFYKTMTLYLGTGAIFTLFMYKVVALKEEIKVNKLNIIVLILAVGIMLSSLLSEYKDIALFGNFDRYEGSLAWFCYLTIFFALYNMDIEEKYYKFFYFILFPFLIINTILSVVKVFGFDVLQLKFVQAMIGANGAAGGEFFTTLYHFNFGSAAGAVIFSVSFMYLLLEEDKKRKILLLVGTVLSFTMTISLISSGGFITMLLITPIILVLGFRFTDDKKSVFKWTCIMIDINAVISIILMKINSKVYEESFAILVKMHKISPIIIPLVIFIFGSLLIFMKFINEKKFFNTVSIVTVVFLSISIFLYSHNLNKENKLIEENSQTSIVRMRDKEIFKKINEMSTDRLNIWTKTIDLINDKPIVGHGFDTFPYVFLSTDKDGGISTYGEVIDKPHNWYISMAYGSGLIGLIGLIGVIFYLIRGFYYNCIDKENDKYLYVFAIGMIAYVIQGLFNDSFVGTSILFWTFSGLCANKIIRKID
ncbi:hypothetical protein CHF27_009040 [Romboutsia maritimum]|uniref:O-antigen ligase-related domain-containing protein n=1 Tax=Romboutsia maritimum TaxID=2020948 RepID=A0A371IS31_9FIRM|nr:O-antigen ligase family protein [Romboutsia maritimum]RDY23279.1 hypothetical protein CHF27_009040 [Romboutsia maritimum]